MPAFLLVSASTVMSPAGYRPLPLLGWRPVFRPPVEIEWACMLLVEIELVRKLLVRNVVVCRLVVCKLEVRNGAGAAGGGLELEKVVCEYVCCG
jgi:hypothetical protein